MDEAIIEWTENQSGVHRTLIRPELAAFAIEMERVLRENDHKTGWDEMSIHQVFGRIKDEFEELQREYILMNNSLDGVDRTYRMRKEAIDIANFCMFLCHNYLKTEEKSETKNRMSANKKVVCPNCGVEFNVVLLIGKRGFKDGYHGECPVPHCGSWYFEAAGDEQP